MIDFFGNENPTLPRVERPYGRGLRIEADATKVNEKKEVKKKKNERDGIRKHLRYMNVCRDAVFYQKLHDLIANKC